MRLPWSESISPVARPLRLDHGRRLVRGPGLAFDFEGERVDGYEGETLAAALSARGVITLRCSHRWHEPRGLYCGIGVCFECVAVVDGLPNVRSCVTPVRDGMDVRRQCLDPQGHRTARGAPGDDRPEEPQSRAAP